MDYVTYVKEGAIATITLQAPHVKNALIQQLKEELFQVVQTIENDRDIKVLLLAGSENAFCAGGDLNGMLQPYDANKIFESMSLSTTIISKLRKLPLITVAVVNGHTAGAGFSLALATDYIISEVQSKWILAFKNVGLIPDLGLHFHLIREIGEKRAKQWIFEGKTLTANECYSYGLINEVVEKNQGISRATEYAHDLLEGPIEAFITSKLLLNRQTEKYLEDIMAQENVQQTLLREKPEHQGRIERLRKTV